MASRPGHIRDPLCGNKEMSPLFIRRLTDEKIDTGPIMSIYTGAHAHKKRREEDNASIRRFALSYHIPGSFYFARFHQDPLCIPIKRFMNLRKQILVILNFVINNKQNKRFYFVYKPLNILLITDHFLLILSYSVFIF